jgi:hypothetical protein
MVMADEIKKQNFLSANGHVARNSYGDYYRVGEKVKHEAGELGEQTAVIERFSVDTESNEIKAHTTKGWAHLDFLRKM